MSKRFLLLVAAMILCMSVFVGCSGDDGKDADTGAIISELQQQIAELREQLEGSLSSELRAELEAQIAELEKKLQDAGALPQADTTPGIISPDDITVAIVGDNVTLTIDGLEAFAAPAAVSTASASLRFNAVNRAYYYTLNSEGVNVATTITDNTVLTNGALILSGIAADVEASKANGVRFLVVLQNTQTGSYVNVLKDYGDKQVRDLVTNQSCMNCHGDFIFRVGKKTAVGNNGVPKESTRAYHRSTVGVEACIVCHENNDPGHSRTNLDLYVHKIHSSSHSDPIAIKNDWNYGIGYPNSMADCASCHVGEERVEKVTAQEYFKYEVCMSCHVDWNGFGWDDTATAWKATHTAMPEDRDCTLCHLGGAVPTFAEFHVGEEAERYNGKNIAYEILDVNYDSATGAGTVEWRAYNTKTNVNYDVLNSDIETGPVFREGAPRTPPGKSAISYATSFVFGFAGEGEDDWTNRGASAKSGQPNYTVAIGAAGATTVDSAKVATTTFTVPATARNNAKAVVGLQGVPLVGDYEFAIVSSVTKEFAVNAATLVPRRNIVDNAKCQSCHGAFVFHGHNRINSVELCVICHSPNATEKDGRILLKELNPELTFVDGKSEESYDLKVMIHRIHTAGAYTGNYTLYRSRAIYGFGKAVADMTGWAIPESPINNGTTGSTIGWTDVEVFYPQPKSGCEACHNEGTYSEAGAGAVPVTLNQGTEYALNAGQTAANAVGSYSDTNDKVIGATRAACASCHTGDAVLAHFKTNITKADIGGDGGCSTCHKPGGFAHGH